MARLQVPYDQNDRAMSEYSFMSSHVSGAPSYPFAAYPSHGFAVPSGRQAWQGPRPRFQMLDLSDEEKLQEKDARMARVREQTIPFKQREDSLSTQHLQALQEIADVIIDYPEIDIVVEGIAGSDEPGEAGMKLTQTRVEACRRELETLGCINKAKVAVRGPKGRSDSAYVRIKPSRSSKLLDPQQRLDAILAGRGFDFAPKTAHMSDRGRRTVAAMARVLREAEDKRVVFTLPRKSSQLAVKRAEVIATAVRESVAGHEVVVQVATSHEDRARVTLEDLEPIIDRRSEQRNNLRLLQKQLDALLAERPLVFKQGVLMPEALTLVEQCAKVLRQAEDTTCVIEVYSGPSHQRSTELQALGRLVIDAMKREGVTHIALGARGVNGMNPYTDGNLMQSGPSVAMTFADKNEVEVLQMDTPEDAGCCMIVGGVEVSEVGKKEEPSLFQSLCCMSDEMDMAQPVRLPDEPAGVSQKPFQVEDGSIYIGEWRGGERWGQGVQEWPNGDRYEGQFVANRAAGTGTFWYSNGDFYKGEWQDDGAHGHGTYSRADGSTYNGQFVHDVQEGQGMEVWPDGKQYVGSYVNGVKHGKGTLTWKDGSKYVGDFYNDVIHGFGVHTWGKDGHRYEGEFRQSVMHGTGLFVHEDGSEYEGEFADGRKHGRGIMRWLDGRVYEGTWALGRQHGAGRMTDRGGVARDEQYYEGKLCTPAKTK